MMHCPACNARLVHFSAVAVLFPLIRVSRRSEVLTCVNCATTTEVDEAGRLLDYRGLTVHHLYVPHPGLQRKLSDVSLQSGGPLFDGENS